jgi:hypothetical protein
VVDKHPVSELDYQFDWSEWLDTDTITSSDWDVPTGLTLADETYNTTTATVWLSGGTNGTTYQVVNTIVTADGRTESKALTVQVTNSGA